MNGIQYAPYPLVMNIHEPPHYFKNFVYESVGEERARVLLRGSSKGGWYVELDEHVNNYQARFLKGNEALDYGGRSVTLLFRSAKDYMFFVLRFSRANQDIPV